MKINWSLMNRLGLMAPEDDDFSSFTPGGKDGSADNSDDGDDDDDAGSSDDDDDDFVENGDDDDDDDLTPATAGGKIQKRQPLVQMDPEALVRSVLAASQGQQGGGQKQLTEAELHQMLGRPQVSPELVAMIRNPEIGPEKVVELLGQLLDGNYKYAMTTTQHLLRHQMQPLLQMQTEWAQHQHQQKRQAFVKELTTTYGALKKYPSAIDRAIEELSAQGFTGKGMAKEQVHKTVAKRARAIVQQIVPEFRLKPQQANGSQRQAGSGFPRRTGKPPGITRTTGPSSFDHIMD